LKHDVAFKSRRQFRCNPLNLGQGKKCPGPQWGRGTFLQALRFHLLIHRPFVVRAVVSVVDMASTESTSSRSSPQSLLGSGSAAVPWTRGKVRPQTFSSSSIF
jgi:hypothetical protein